MPHLQVGIGLPNAVMGVPGTRLLDWGRRAEERGFSAVCTIGRLVHPSHDDLVSLAAVAGATTRIGLLTNVLIGPVHRPLQLAKAAATLQAVSGGRFTLGIGVGWRSDDFAAVGRAYERRGVLLDEQLGEMNRAWQGEVPDGLGRPVAPITDVPVLIGGNSRYAVERTARWGAGWTAGGADMASLAGLVADVRKAWADAGRDGEPRLAGQVYVGLGDDRRAESQGNLRDYYSMLGAGAEDVAQSCVLDAASARATVRDYESAGFTELYFAAASGAIDQVDRLADAVL